MVAPMNGREAFVIQILSNQNSTWQGTITWTSTQQMQPFRSLLELIKLIDSTLGVPPADETGK